MSSLPSPSHELLLRCERLSHAVATNSSSCSSSPTPSCPSSAVISAAATATMPGRSSFGAILQLRHGAPSQARSPCGGTRVLFSGLQTTSPLATCLTSAAGSLRSVFGVAPVKVNKQIHTHDKYKQIHPQPAYSWMVGRFIRDRNGAIWHKQANSSHRKHNKSSSQITRLKRLKPLAPAFARKFRKLGFKRMYWNDPDPRTVPGFHGRAPYRPLPRLNADPDMRPDIGDPALRPH